MCSGPRSCLHSGMASVDFDKAFGSTGTLKTSKYLLMAGPIGKYILQGVFHPAQQAAVFRSANLECGVHLLAGIHFGVQERSLFALT